MLQKNAWNAKVCRSFLQSKKNPKDLAISKRINAITNWCRECTLKTFPKISSHPSDDEASNFQDNSAANILVKAAFENDGIKNGY